MRVKRPFTSRKHSRPRRNRPRPSQHAGSVPRGKAVGSAHSKSTPTPLHSSSRVFAKHLCQLTWDQSQRLYGLAERATRQLRSRDVAASHVRSTYNKYAGQSITYCVCRCILRVGLDCFTESSTEHHDVFDSHFHRGASTLKANFWVLVSVRASARPTRVGTSHGRSCSNQSRRRGTGRS